MFRGEFIGLNGGADFYAADIAVATAYGWDDYTPDMPDEEILARLFALNQERAEATDV